MEERRNSSLAWLAYHHSLNINVIELISGNTYWLNRISMDMVEGKLLNLYPGENLIYADK